MRFFIPRRRLPKMSGKAGGHKQLTSFRIKGDCVHFSLKCLAVAIEGEIYLYIYIYLYLYIYIYIYIYSALPTFLKHDPRDFSNNFTRRFRLRDFEGRGKKIVFILKWNPCYDHLFGGFWWRCVPLLVDYPLVLVIGSHLAARIFRILTHCEVLIIIVSTCFFRFKQSMAEGHVLLRSDLWRHLPMILCETYRLHAYRDFRSV